MRNKDKKNLGQVNPEMGIIGNLFSTVWLISRITEILINKKLAAQVNEKEFITGWQWYTGENK